MPNIKTTSGILWEYDLEGEGKTILFIHGWGVDRRIWKQQVKHFSQKHQVMTIDLPGHGNTPWRSINLTKIAEDLKEIMELLAIKKFVIVGSSLGGLVGLKLYTLCPEKIEKLIFVGSMPKFSMSADYPFGLNVEKIRKLDGQVKSSFPGIIHIFFRSLFTNEERASRRFKWLQRFRRTDTVPMKEALSEYLNILENEDLREALRKVNTPVQFINGREDTICSHQTVEYLKTLLPRARYDFFEKCGHFPFLSKPYEFNEVLEKFVES